MLPLRDNTKKHSKIKTTPRLLYSMYILPLLPSYVAVSYSACSDTITVTTTTTAIYHTVTPRLIANYTNYQTTISCPLSISTSLFLVLSRAFSLVASNPLSPSIVVTNC